MSEIKTVSVYCGATEDTDKKYYAAARELGEEIAKRGLTLAFGASYMGLMREVSNATKENGGKVVGVISKEILAFAPQASEEFYDEHYIMEDYSGRKSKLFELGDVFVVMPGGIGSFDELFASWCENCFLKKPRKIGILNIDGYYTHFLKQIDRSHADNFISKERYQMISAFSSVPELMSALVDQV